MRTTQLTINTTAKDNDFTFYDFANSNRNGRKITPEDIIVVNNKKGHYSIVFNRFVSETIKKTKNVKLRIRVDNVTGDIHLVFNKEIGLDVSTNHKHFESDKNISVNNKDMVSLIFKLLKTDINILRKEIRISSNLSNTDEYCTYKIIKQ